MQILEHGQEQEQTLLFFPCTAEPVWAFPPERFTLPGHDPVKEYNTMEVYLKTYSDRTIHNVFWSGNNYALPQPRHIGCLPRRGAVERRRKGADASAERQGRFH